MPSGVWFIVRTQHNAWIHLVATVGVVVADFVFRLAAWERCAILFAIGMVWIAEALNSAREFLADEVSRERRELIGRAKDAGAAGVLLAAITSALIGLIVFVPHLMAWLYPTWR